MRKGKARQAKKKSRAPERRKVRRVSPVNEEARVAVLVALRRAAGRGASLAQLGVRRNDDARHRALRALVGAGDAVVFGDGRDALAILADRAPSKEALAKKIDARASLKRAAVLGREDMAAWCSAAEEYLLDAALRSLVKSGRLVALRRGGSVLYGHADSLGAKGPMPPAAPPPPEPPVAHEPRFRIIGAYRRLVEQGGFSDVVIADLRREAGMAQEELAAWLLEQSRMGRAHLGRGDWSLADDAARQAAVTAAGEPHLRVRLVI
ncbi:MAG: hypothetical protein IT577_09975 [Verrucomicrobiae bacterium]|nr:hypothetical protein [Verrucomicrobiae bacterium]